MVATTAGTAEGHSFWESCRDVGRCWSACCTEMERERERERERRREEEKRRERREARKSDVIIIMCTGEVKYVK